MDFEFSYTIDYSFDLDYDDIGTAATTCAEAADETTGGDRSEWRLFIHGTEIGVGFNCEGCRDRFIEIYERVVQHEQDDDAPPASMKRVRGRSRPTCSDPIATDDPCAQA